MFRVLGLALIIICTSLYSLSANVIGEYAETTLQTNQTDSNLVNPWGIAFTAGSPFWIADNGAGNASVYNSAGMAQALVVSMPSGAQQVDGEVSNTSSNFHGDTFLFATSNGAINGWRNALGTSAETLFTQSGADYKGLAIDGAGDTLYSANFASGNIDIFNSTGLEGSFSDPNIPAGFAPFNVENIGGTIFVTFAKVGTNGNASPGSGNGFVAVFNPTTHTFTPLISQGVLNSPWGLAIAPASFGAAAGDLLVGNFGDGTINAFNPNTGQYLGTLANVSGSALATSGLWAITFGDGGNAGSANSLYVTAGPNGQTGGLFAEVDPAPEPSTLVLGAIGLACIALAARRSPRSRR